MSPPAGVPLDHPHEGREEQRAQEKRGRHDVGEARGSAVGQPVASRVAVTVDVRGPRRPGPTHPPAGCARAGKVPASQAMRPRTQSTCRSSEQREKEEEKTTSIIAGVSAPIQVAQKWRSDGGGDQRELNEAGEQPGDRRDDIHQKERPCLATPSALRPEACEAGASADTRGPETHQRDGVATTMTLHSEAVMSAIKVRWRPDAVCLSDPERR